jgi:hypothetical protein
LRHLQPAASVSREAQLLISDSTKSSARHNDRQLSVLGGTNWVKNGDA